MAGHDHGPNLQGALESSLTKNRNARYGLILFTIYLALYGGFVLVSAFRREWLDVLPFGGLNLAIVYGLGLIVAAAAMAFLYGWLCRNEA